MIVIDWDRIGSGRIDHDGAQFSGAVVRHSAVAAPLVFQEQFQP